MSKSRVPARPKRTGDGVAPNQLQQQLTHDYFCVTHCSVTSQKVSWVYLCPALSPRGDTTLHLSQWFPLLAPWQPLRELLEDLMPGTGKIPRVCAALAEEPSSFPGTSQPTTPGNLEPLAPSLTCTYATHRHIHTHLRDLKIIKINRLKNVLMSRSHPR